MKQVTKKLLLGAAVWLGSTLVCSLFCLLALSRDFSSMPPMLWTVPLLLGTLNMLLTYVALLVGYLEEKSYRSDAPASWTVPLSLLAMWSAAFITTGAVCKGFSLLTGMAVSWRTLVLLSGLCGATVAALHSAIRYARRRIKTETRLKIRNPGQGENPQLQYVFLQVLYTTQKGNDDYDE